MTIEAKQQQRIKMGAKYENFVIIKFQSIWGHAIAYVTNKYSNLVVVK